MSWRLFARAGGMLMLTVLVGCDKPRAPASAVPTPSRRAGLWELDMARDGGANPWGGLKACLDNATDARLGVFGQRLAQGGCARSVTRDAMGAYHFESTCRLAGGGVVLTRGVASGDFNAAYHVRSDIDVTGAPLEPLNGAHEVDVNGRFLGPCPGGMRPGDVKLGSGLKVNLDRLPQLASAIAGG